MTIVKGSKQRSLKVIEDKPIQRFAMGTIAVVFMVAAAVGAYLFGVDKGMAGQDQALQQVAQLSADVKHKKARLLELEQELVNIRLGAEVDRQSSEDVRKEVADLKEEIAELKADNSFYRNLMAPTKNARGLNFGVVELAQTGSPREYHYKIVMQQLATNHELLSGYLDVSILGREGEFEKSYSLNELSNDYKTKSVKLRFKYFQTVEGDLQLPEGFEPERLELKARSTGKNAVTIEKRYGWLAEET